MSNRWNNLKRWGGHGLRIGLAALAIGAVVYWLGFSPIAVTEHRVGRGELIAEVMGTGTLEARVEASISPKISGRIEAVLADQGDRVEQGKLLVQLDDEELRQQVEIAQANLAAAQAAIERLDTDKAEAQAVAIQARKHRERVQSLYAGKAISQQELDKAIEALEVAEARVARAEAAMAGGQKELIAAAKTLEYQRARLAYTRITAPFPGVIVRRYRDPGDIVVPGSAILSLVSTEELWISAWVDEIEMAQIRPEQPARVIFRSEPDRTYSGRVARLGREVDRETREFIVDVRVLELPANWAVGQRAEVYIETGRKNAVTLIPAAYVVWHDSTAGVFFNANQRAAWRPITVGSRSREMVEITEGLSPGDTLVKPLTAQTPLTEGQRISITP